MCAFWPKMLNLVLYCRSRDAFLFANLMFPSQRILLCTKLEVLTGLYFLCFPAACLWISFLFIAKEIMIFLSPAYCFFTKNLLLPQNKKFWHVSTFFYLPSANGIISFCIFLLLRHKQPSFNCSSY